MLTIDAVKSAILEILDDSEDLTMGEIWRALRTEMHPKISFRDCECAVGALLKSGRLCEENYLDPHSGNVGNPSSYYKV